MRIISLSLIIFLSCVICYAQDKKTAVELKPEFVIGYGDCGDSAVESQIYANRQGKITRIINANEVIFQQISENGNKSRKRFIVKIIGIDRSQNESNIKNFLDKYVLNQSVEIFGNLKEKSDKKFGGSIWLQSGNANIGDLNEYLLENGIAKFEDFDSANLVSLVMPCELRKAEEKAKTTKLGIWAK